MERQLLLLLAWVEAVDGAAGYRKTVEVNRDRNALRAMAIHGKDPPNYFSSSALNLVF
jgi:hypothetical protein